MGFFGNRGCEDAPFAFKVDLRRLVDKSLGPKLADCWPACRQLGGAATVAAEATGR